MARIKILELPTQVLGDVVTTPFALIIDQVDTWNINALDGTPVRVHSELTQAEADVIAAQVGAVGAILTTCTLDIDR